MENFYIAYSYIEEENSANQVQSKNTYESLKKIEPFLKGIFLGNRKNLFWKIRQEKDRYFVDRINYKVGVVEKYFKIGIFRKNLFPNFFAWKAGKVLKKYKDKKNVYTRLACAEEGIFYLKKLDELNIGTIILEAHSLIFDVPNFYYWNFEKRYCYKKYVDFFDLLKKYPKRAKLVTLTKNLADTIKDRFDYKEKIEIIPDAHNINNCKPNNVNFDKEKIEIIYTGLNFQHRGVEVILKALEFLPNNFYLRLVGGRKREREDIGRNYQIFVDQNKLILEEPVSNSMVKEKLTGADIAVLPTPASGFSDFTSPLKLFDYMALGMPIVASDTKSFKEILTTENALFFKENSSKDLADKIVYLYKNKSLAKKIGNNAFIDSQKYTYEKRAEKINNLLLHE